MKRSFSRRSGMIFVTVLGTLVILAAMVLIFGQSMRTEAVGSANRLSAIQADAIEQGAEQWVLSTVETNAPDAYTITQEIANSRRIGKGYFWLLSPDPEQDQDFAYGIVDESSKVNLNVATSDTNNNTGTTTGLTLLNLPNMTNDVADNIVAWRSSATATSSGATNGAQSDYYSSLPQPYVAKNAPFETVEELLLIRDLTPDMLFGYDTNRNGVIEPLEQDQSNGAASVNSGSTDSRGFYNYVTAWSVEPNNAVDGTARTNVNDGADAVQKVFTNAGFNSSRISAIMARLQAVYNPPRSTTRTPTRTATTQGTAGTTLFPSLAEFYIASGMNSTEFAQVADKFTASSSKTLTGLVNLATASSQVIQCLPGLDESDAEAIISARTNGADTSNIAWVFDAVSSTKMTGIASRITSRSYIYSADIVAVSGDGRAFKRVKIVVDAQKLPAKIIYRRDLTSLGWPLDPRIREDLRAGRYVPPDNPTNSDTGIIGGMR